MSPRRWWTVAAGLVVVVTAGAVVADQRARAQVDELVAIGGTLAPLDGPVGERWTSDVSLMPRASMVAGRLIGVDSRADGGVDVVGLDPATGAAVWRAALRPAGRVVGWVTCAVPAASRDVPSRVVTCVVADEVVITAETATAYAFAPRLARLVVVDATDGTVQADALTEPSTTITTFGPDLVLGSVDDAGHAHVARTDARGVTRRWTFDTPGVVPTNDEQQRAVAVTVTDGLVVVDAGPTYVLTGGGTVRHVWTPDPSSALSGRLTVLDHGRLLAEPAAAAAGAARTTLIDRDSRRRVTVPGTAVRPVTDDGSLSTTVLAQSDDDRLLAYERSTGRLLWRTPAGSATGAGLVVVLAGRVLRLGADELGSIDGRTGLVEWSTPVDQAARGPLLTDGRLLLLTARDRESGAILAAYGLDDGRQRWTVPVADGLTPFVVNHALFGATPARGVVALG